MEPTQTEYDKLIAEREKLEAQVEAIEEKLMQYAPEVMALAGAVVTLDHAGKPVVHAGLLRPEDAQTLRREERDTARECDGPAPGERPAKQGISEALARKLSSHRTAAMQIELARQPAIALAALVHPLALRLIYDEPSMDSIVKITGVRQTKLAGHASDMDGAPAALAFAECLQAWKERLPGDPEQLLATLLALPQDDLLALLALCVASTLDAVTSSETGGCGDELARVLHLDMRKWWTATAESYFGQVSKAKIEDAMRVFAPQQASRVAALKKFDMASEAERLAVDSGWLPAMLAVTA